MALSASTKANIENLKRNIETMKGEIESLNRTIANNNATRGSKSAGDYAKQRKKNLQEEIKRKRAAIADWKKRG